MNELNKTLKPFKIGLVKAWACRTESCLWCKLVNYPDKWSNLIVMATDGSDGLPHPVDEALHEPLGAVDSCRHLLPVLQSDKQEADETSKSFSVGSFPRQRWELTMCLFSLGRSLERIWSWWAWNRWSLGNPGTKKPGNKETQQKMKI